MILVCLFSLCNLIYIPLYLLVVFLHISYILYPIHHNAQLRNTNFTFLLMKYYQYAKISTNPQTFILGEMFISIDIGSGDSSDSMISTHFHSQYSLHILIFSSVFLKKCPLLMLWCKNICKFICTREMVRVDAFS